MTSLGYHDNEDTTTLILDKLGHASVEFLLNKPRKILQFTLQGNSLFTTTSAFLLFTQRRAGGPGVCRYARACVSFAAEDGREGHFLSSLNYDYAFH